jgi:hypothetical protein
MFKLLVDRFGLLFSVTMKNRAIYFFFSSPLIGIRFAPTTDPYPGIVEICNYDILAILKNWERLRNIKVTSIGPIKS